MGAEQILKSLRITCTWTRTEILGVVINNPYVIFTVSEIRALMAAKGVSISRSGVLSTLSLFSARGLIAESRIDNNYADNARMGRPKTKFTATLQLINTINKISEHEL